MRVVAAARAGYDPFVLVDVLTTINSINFESEEASVMLKAQQSMEGRMVQLVDKIVGRLDSRVSGLTNPGPLQKISADLQ